MAQTITLITFDQFGKSFLEQLKEAVGEEFNVNVTIKEAYLDLSLFFDPTRRQYNGNKLLPAVDEIGGNNGGKNLGLFTVDLFIPILTFIFGQAYLGGKTGIASLFRLGNERYGLEANEGIKLERFIKVVIHELGHAFGLIHCTVSTCVMRPGTYVEDLDQKGRSFCPDCREKLHI